jgi:hypothetical protein
VACLTKSAKNSESLGQLDGLYYDERSRGLREIYEIADRLFGNPEKS